MIGKTLAHYEITGVLGKGGMGEVFQARDTKLGREVALKLLPRDVALDPERLARFQREAKLLATLNHPAIASLHGIEESDSHVFLVMELVEGEDLSKRIHRGAMPVDEALTVALHIAEALQAAHAANIVHRDLKPANVVYAPNGRVKLLDFGLARAYQSEESAGDTMISPTITAAMTQQGTILGTAAYMSPEQARGKSVDRQADIWAFGVVLYEMLTAHRLFQGETVSDSIGAILHKEPEWTRLPGDTPPQIRQLLAQCLERDCSERLHDIADARVAILDAQRDPSGSRLGLATVVGSQGKSRKNVIALFTALAGLMAGLVAGPMLFPDREPKPYRIFDLGVEILPAAEQRIGIHTALSPDGGSVVYTHDGQLWLQRFDQLQPLPLAQTENAIAPFWSPDGSQIGWFRGNRILKTPVRGGRSVALCEFKGSIGGGVGAYWGDNGRILFATGSSGIYTVSELGGQISELIEPGVGYGDLHEPYGLPDDRGILFVSHPNQRRPGVLEIWRDGERRILFEAPENARIYFPCYDDRGFILFRLTHSETTPGLWAMAFDDKTGEVGGEPFLVEPDARGATIDQKGNIVFVMSPHRSEQQEVVQIGFNGERQEVLASGNLGQTRFKLSPDGRRLAFTTQPTAGSTSSQLWVKDLVRDIKFQLPVPPEWGVWELDWSTDNQHLYFIGGLPTETQPSTLKIAADGSGSGIILSEGPGNVVPGGDQILLVTGIGDSPIGAVPDTTEIWLQALADPDARRLVLGGDGLYFPDHFAPDGNYLLYYLKRGDEEACYLTRFPEFTGRWKVSQGNDVSSSSFAPDGSAIYYVSDRALFRVAFEGGPTPVLGRPERVCEIPDGAGFNVQLHPDGDSYIVTVDAMLPEGAENRHRIKIVQNWTAKID